MSTVDGIANAAAIIGIGATDFTSNSNTTVLNLAVQASLGALDDAGLGIEEVGGIISYQLGDSVLSRELAAAIGLPELKWYADLQEGGPGAVLAIAEACMAIHSGLVDNVLVFRAMNGRSGRRMSLHRSHEEAKDAWQWMLPFGVAAPAQFFAMWAQRHMHEFGTTTEQLGSVAVTFRDHAQANPSAYFYGKPLALDDYMGSRLISSPFRLYDCCLETDGAVALLLTGKDRAKSYRASPVFVAGFAHGAGPQAVPPFSAWPDHTVMFPKYVSQGAMDMAQVTRSEIDFAQIYDAFTFGVICQLEDLGFVDKGEGGPFVEEGNIGSAGSLPVNLNGGLLSEGYVHGLNNVAEAVKQLRGEAGVRQVDGARHGLVTAFGGAMGGVMILARDH